MSEFGFTPPLPVSKKTGIKKTKISKDILEFEKESATLYRREIEKRRQVKRIAIPDFLKELKKEIAIETPLLPEGARYYAGNRDRGVLIIEQPPCIRTITWSTLSSYDTIQKRTTRKKYTLAFPYIILICPIADDEIIDVFIFYRTAPFVSMDDELYCTNLPNITDDNRVCLGREVSSGSLIKQADQVLNRLWNSSFNTDLNSGRFTLSMGIDSRISSMEAWQEASARDEFFMLKVPWQVAYETVRGAIQVKCFGLAGDHISTLDDMVDVFYRCAP